MSFSILGLVGFAIFGFADSPPRPNVLWLCADDHAAYVAGCYGNRVVRTPSLDRLANAGTRFDRAYCNSPVCTASRMAFLTGRYPRTIGVTQLGTALPGSESTIADLLALAGYRTIGIGKMHFNGPLKHGFESLIDAAEYRQWIKTQPRDPLPIEQRVLGPWKPFRDAASVWLNADCLPEGVTERQSQGRFFADRAGEFLNVKGDRPFFAFVSFYEPHSPFHFPIEYAGRHRGNEFVAPKIEPVDRWQIPLIFADLTDAQKCGIQAAYYTSTEFMDACLGQVLDALERSGKANNTLVIYTGDHGYMLGQHGRLEKHCGFEPAIRAPLLIRLPASRTPKMKIPATPALVEFIDILPTILDVCNLPRPAKVQGRSLLPLLEGKTVRQRDRVFVEYSENEEAYVVDDRWKLIFGTGKRVRNDGHKTANPTPGRYIKLYNLQTDLDELVDLSSHAHKVLELCNALADHLKQTARKPQAIAANADPVSFIESALAPDDVKPAR